jgi:hypothetical protein
MVAESVNIGEISMIFPWMNFPAVFEDKILPGFPRWAGFLYDHPGSNLIVASTNMKFISL